MSLKDVYIGKAKSENFDFNVPGNPNGYMPEPAYDIPKPWPTYPGEDELFWAVLHEPDAKQLDWGCHAVRMSVAELREWLSAPRWTGNKCAAMLLEKLDTLAPAGDYVLAASEFDFS